MAFSGLGSLLGSVGNFLFGSQLGLSNTQGAVSIGTSTSMPVISPITIPAGSFGAVTGSLTDPSKAQPQGLNDSKPEASQYGRAVTRYWGKVGIQGNVRWCSDFTKKSVSISGTTAGAAASVTETYVRSFAIQLADCPSDAVLRIWSGPEKRLIYDATTGVNTVVGADLGKFRMYLGTSTQLPDPTIEAAEGAGNVPAWRGETYIVGIDWPLTKDGNRLPIWTVEVVSKATAHLIPYYTITTDGGGAVGYNPANNQAFWYSDTTNTLYVYDVKTRTMLQTITMPVAGMSPILGWAPGVLANDTIIAVGINGPASASPTGYYISSLTGTITGFHASIKAVTLSFWWPAGTVYANGALWQLDVNGIGTKTMWNLTTGAEAPGHWFDQAMTVTQPPTNGKYAVLWEVTTRQAYVFDGVSTFYILTGINSAYTYFTEDTTRPGVAYFIDAGVGTGNVRVIKWDVGLPGTLTTVATYNTSGFSVMYAAYDSNNDVLWMGVNTTIGGGSTDDLWGLNASNLQTVNAPVTGPPTGAIVYSHIVGGSPYTSNQSNPSAYFSPITGEIVAVGGGGGAWLVSTKTLYTANEVTLADIVQDLGDSYAPIGLDDVTDLVPITVTGFKLERQTTIRAAIETLQSIYFFDGVESDGNRKWIRRGGSVAATQNKSD